MKRVVVVVAAALLVYSTLGIVQRIRGTLSGGSGGFSRALQGVDAAALNMVRLVGPTDSVELARVDARWLVNGFVADTGAVTGLLAAIATSRVGSVASNNPAEHARLGVAGAEAWRLQFRDVDDRVTEIVLGKTGVRFGSAFARLPEEETVVTLVGNLRPSVVKTLDQWRDRSVAVTDTAQVATIHVTANSVDYRLTRRGAEWRLGGVEADSFTVATLLNELSSVTAIGFADEGTEPTGDRRSLVATSEAGDTLVQLDGWVEDRTFLLTTAAGDGVQDVIYEMSDWRADRLMPPLDSVRAR